MAMAARVVVLCVFGLCASQSAAKAALNDEETYTLPAHILIGAGVSACQVEGAWNLSGKAESVLDRMAHVPNNPIFHSNADVSADHYHRYKEDLAMAKKMKFTSHRFSISWSRVLPTGDTSNVNHEGVRFYHDYIDEVIRLGMEPMVTMLHFDQPYTMEQETGGWSQEAMVQKYVDYADFLFSQYGEKVKYWNTVNEPNMYCNYFPTVMYMSGLAPKDDGNIYRCMHHMVLAHMKTYRLYKEKYYSKQNGFVGTSVLLWPSVPASTNAEDVIASETFNTMFAGTILHPLVYGDYPPITRHIVDSRSKEMGLKASRLPYFTSAEKEQLAGSTDFIAVNVYSSFVAAYRPNGTDSDSDISPTLLGPILNDMPTIKLSGNMANFDTVDETLMHDALLWIWNAYHVPIIISENGYGDTTGLGLRDTARSAYHSANLRSLVRTMKQFDIEVWGYYVWALIDSFEFSAGYDQRPFGLVHIDFKSASLDRTLKDSWKFFADLGANRQIPYIPLPTSGSSVQQMTLWLTLTMTLVAFSDL